MKWMIHDYAQSPTPKLEGAPSVFLVSIVYSLQQLILVGCHPRRTLQVRWCSQILCDVHVLKRSFDNSQVGLFPFCFFSNAEDVNFDGLFSFRPSVFMATSAPSIHARPEHRLCFSLCFRCVRSRQPAAGWYWDQSYSHLSFSFQSQCHFHADHMGVSWNRGTVSVPGSALWCVHFSCWSMSQSLMHLRFFFSKGPLRPSFCLAEIPGYRFTFLP